MHQKCNYTVLYNSAMSFYPKTHGSFYACVCVALAQGQRNQGQPEFTSSP